MLGVDQVDGAGRCVGRGDQGVELVLAQELVDAVVTGGLDAPGASGDVLLAAEDRSGQGLLEEVLAEVHELPIRVQDVEGHHVLQRARYVAGPARRGSRPARCAARRASPAARPPSPRPPSTPGRWRRRSRPLRRPAARPPAPPRCRRRWSSPSRAPAARRSACPASRPSTAWGRSRCLSASTPSSAAASATVSAIGPGESWDREIGTTPSVGTRPTVGLIPTTPLNAAGQVIDPSVSVPIASGASPAATAAPLPELDPPGGAVEAVGVAGQPAVAAPAGRREPVTDVGPLAEVGLAQHHHPGRAQPAHERRRPEPGWGRRPARASRRWWAGRAVSTLSFTRIGTPCSGPRTPVRRRSRRRAPPPATSTSGFSVQIALVCTSTVSIRSSSRSTWSRDRWQGPGGPCTRAWSRSCRDRPCQWDVSRCADERRSPYPRNHER